MGALFAILFLGFLFVIGVIGIAVGVVGLIVCGKRKKAGELSGRILTVVFAIVLSIGFVIALIPVGFFSLIVIVNSVPLDGFVETDIVIEENGYQDTRFTADGVVYEVLDFQIYDSDAISEPIFTYKTAGFLKGSQCGNYYAVENYQGFNLVSDEFGLLFSPVEERNRIIAYYTDLENLCGYYDDWDDREFKLSDDENEAVLDFLDTDIASLTQEQFALDGAEDFEIKLICKDGLVYVESYWFLIFNDVLYYVCDSDFAEEGIRYTLVKLPIDVAEPLLNIHNKS